MYNKGKLLVLYFLLFELILLIKCEHIYELTDDNCHHSHDNFTSLFIQNTITNNNSTNKFKTCYLNFNSNSINNFIIKFNLNTNLCINTNNTNNNDNNKVNLMLTFYDVNANKTINRIDNKNLCDLSNVNNYILLNQTNNFAINLTNSLNIDGLFDVVKLITISKFVYPDAVECKTNEFKCVSPELCIEKSSICEKFTICPDNSDEGKCSITLNPSTSTLSQKTTIPNSNATSNATKENNNKPTSNNTDNSTFGKVKVLIGILITLLIIITIVGVIWIYGRRKRRFREFLAQLDNNTDWEYEQLDDGPPSLNASRATMTPIFSMLNHNENSSRRNVTQNGGTNDNDLNLMHTLTDINRMTQNNTNISSNANTTRNINERTPITVIS